MTADVSSLNRSSNSLTTQDLLAGLSRPGNAENRLDPKSGQAYHRRSYSPIGDHRKQELQDLNYPPAYTLLAGDTSSWTLELKLDSSSSSSSSSPSSSGSTRSFYQSVCTLDKVKSALQRAEQGTVKKRPLPSGEETEPKTTPSSGMFATACPGCLLYVITQKTNPKCPRCGSLVTCPPPVKKPRIDLNATQQFD